MEKLILAFLAVLLIAFIGNTIFTEAFGDYEGGIRPRYDASGNLIGKSVKVESDALGGRTLLTFSSKTATSDASGGILSRSDSSGNIILPSAPSTKYEIPGTSITEEKNLDSFYYPNLTDYDPCVSDKGCKVVSDQKKLSRSPCVQQGKDYKSYAPAMNPAEWIRKDSIPCYACTL
jgi:hypothetical protein